MSIIQIKKDAEGKITSADPLSIDNSKLTADKFYKTQVQPSPYMPSDEEKEVRSMILRHFSLGYVTMYTPRVEFNDLCVIDRMQIDQMSFNTYQPNNGQAPLGDELNAWKSRAMKPIVRNKAVSIAAHTTAHLIFPKVFAYNDESESQSEAAQVMRDLMEWSAEQSNYAQTSLYATVAALTDPASIVYTEYGEVYRTVKRNKVKGKYQQERILDPILSGFKDTMVPCDELFIENFYEKDIQKQGWLIWRRVYSYALAETKYKALYPEKFKYVTPGVQIVYNDANQTFYQVYDTNMRPYDVEEVIYFNRTLDLKIIMVNGVMLTDPDNANPRNDKLYPFVKFGYEIINSRCFYYKSLAFKLQQDANIINTLYPMIIDGTYLSIFPAMVNLGGEEIGSDVIIPGAVTTLSDPNADLRAIQSTNPRGLQVGMETLRVAENSLDDSSISPMMSGSQPPYRQTAYQASVLSQNATTVLGLFIQMVSLFVKSYGQLRMGDILQYLTILDADKITDRPLDVYKTFLLNNKNDGMSKVKNKKIKFTNQLPDEPQTSDQQLQLSYQVLEEQGGPDSETELYKVNPSLFRNLVYTLAIDADILNPRSEEVEKAFDLETYDRMVQNPEADPEETFKLLLSTNTKTKKDPDKFIKKAPSDPLGIATMQATGQDSGNMQQTSPGQPNGQIQASPQMPQAGNSPLNSMKSGNTVLPANPSSMMTK